MKTLACLIVMFSTTSVFAHGYGHGWTDWDNYDAFWSPRVYNYYQPVYQPIYQPRYYGGYHYGGGMGAPANLIPMNMGY